VCTLSLGILYGLAKMLEDKNKSLFLLFIALSIIPLLLSNFVRMLVFVFPIMILALSKAFNSAFKIGEVDKRLSKLNIILLVLILAGLVSAPFAYGFVYSKIVGKYLPFYQKANELLPKDAVVCNMFDDQFFNNVDRKMAPAGMIPEKRVTFPCATDPSNQTVCFKDHNVDYVCCTSLRTLVLGGELQKFCEKTMMEKKLDIEYNGEGVWGRCWKI
jgi:energy-coupling factor transporter transmembrane protein EcfT